MKVSFGIKKLHYALIDPVSGLYRVPVSMPGAVSLGVSGSERELTLNSSFGDIPFGKEKGSVSGSLVIASLPLAFLYDVFGIEIDENGVEIEHGFDEVRHFALLYQTNTDEGKIRECWYDCTATRPQYSIVTNDTGVTIATRQLNITMRRNAAKLIRGYKTQLRARVASDKAAYDTFFSEVYGA